MFWLPREVLALIHSFDGTYRDATTDALKELSGLLIATYMVLDRRFTIRNYVENRWHHVPRYVKVVVLDKSVEQGGHYLRFNKHGRRCFAFESL